MPAGTEEWHLGEQGQSDAPFREATLRPLHLHVVSEMRPPPWLPCRRGGQQHPGAAGHLSWTVHGSIHRRAHPGLKHVQRTLRWLSIRANTALANPNLRRALFCCDRPECPRAARADCHAADILHAAGRRHWFNPDAPSPAATDTTRSRLDPAQAASILKAAGYTWSTNHRARQAGAGLRPPDGKTGSGHHVAGTSGGSRSGGATAARFDREVRPLPRNPDGRRPASPSDIRFAVFNDGEYDLAIVGWRLSAYPGYLCDWFGQGIHSGTRMSQIQSACQHLTPPATSTARRQVFADPIAPGAEPAVHSALFRRYL